MLLAIDFVLLDFFKDNSGCEVCICNDAPTCLATNVAAVCNLNCILGYKTSNGCPICECEAVKPCDCTDPIKTSTICSDKTTSTAYIGCKRDVDSNLCVRIYQQCPVPIACEPKIPGTLLSDADIQNIKYEYNIPDAEVKIDIITKSNGDKYYILWVSKEALPADFDFAKIAESINKANPTGVNAYLLTFDNSQSGNGPSGSAVSFVVPLIAMLFVMFM